MFSGMCPPAFNDKPDSVSAFSNYSLSDSERTCALPSTSIWETEAVRWQCDAQFGMTEIEPQKVDKLFSQLHVDTAHG